VQVALLMKMGMLFVRGDNVMDVLFLGLATIGMVWFLIVPGLSLKSETAHKLSYLFIAMIIIGAVGFVWKVFL